MQAPSSPSSRSAHQTTQPVVQKIVASVSQILIADERIEYVAVQRRVLSFDPRPDAVVLTNRRFILYQPKLLGGVRFEDYIWRDLADARLEEGLLSATLWLRTQSGRILRVAHLPKPSARRLYAVAQQREQEVHEERRSREMEEKRAAAGGILFQSSNVPAAVAPSGPAFPMVDPVNALRQLKELADQGLIQPDEYAAKRAEILRRL